MFEYRDIFITEKNELYLITDYIPTKDEHNYDITCELNGVQTMLKLVTMAKAPQCVGVHKCQVDGTSEVNVVFNGHKYTVERIKQPHHYLSLCTLFKDDYDLVPQWIDYYTRRGVEHFYLYYNGTLEELYRKAPFFKEFSPDIVTLKAWPYIYWKAPGVHAAQPPAMHSGLYRSNTDWLGFFDLDEYVNHCDIKLYLSSLNRNNTSSVVFDNSWAKMSHKNVHNTPIIRNKQKEPRRSKFIINTDNVIGCGVHRERKIRAGKQVFSHVIFFHFYDWSGRRNDVSKWITEPIKAHYKKYENIDMITFLQQYKGKEIVFIPNPGNAGDSLIAYGTMQLFDKVGLNYVIDSNTDKTNKVLFLAGGGNLVGLYSSCHNVLSQYMNSNEIVVLPHTIDKCDNLLKKLPDTVKIICRDRRSYDYVHGLIKHKDNVLLSHDMAFHIEGIDEVKRTRGTGLLNCFRTDREKVSMPLPANNIDLSVTLRKAGNTSNKECIKEVALSVFKKLSQYDTINTNRLHIAIAGSLLGKKVNLFPGSYFKNQEVFNHSLKYRYPNVQFKLPIMINSPKLPIVYKTPIRKSNKTVKIIHKKLTNNDNTHKKVT